MGKFRDGISRIFNTFIGTLPEDANRQTNQDTGNVAKTSPWLFDYDVFKINWYKVDLLREIDHMMREDVRIKRANHIFASTAVRRGMSVKVTSAVSEDIEKKAQDIIDDFMRRTRLTSKLLPWARSLLKDGELFLNPIVDTTQGLITDVKNLPAITMQRNEDIKGRFENIKTAFVQIDPVSRQPLQQFPLWSINHIRYDHEPGQLYGNSQYMGCLVIWKRLKMMEEDLVVRRRTRAVPRRMHSVGNKDNPQDWSEIDKYKQMNRMNAKTTAVTTDFFGNGLVDVKDLNADAYLDHIKDVEYQQQLLMIGTGVPLPLVGFGENINRDVVADQKEQFDEAVQELRDLLESGDESSYSGIRCLFDFQLQLQGINPELVDYNFLWTENNAETIDQKVDRMIKLRSSQPEPLISRKTAIAYLGRDLNFENQEAVDAEIQQIKEEEDEARQEQQTMQTALNPLKPSPTPVNHSTSLTAGKPTTDAAEPTEHPLHSKKVVDLEKSLADDIRSFFLQVWDDMKENGIEAKLAKVQKLKPHFDSVEPMTEDTRTLIAVHDAHCSCGHCITDAKKQVPLDGLVEQHVIDEFDQAWQRRAEDQDQYGNPVPGTGFRSTLIDAYGMAARFAGDNVQLALEQAGTGLRFDFTHSGVLEDLKSVAGERITGIEHTTRQLIRVQMAQAYENGETLPEWMARIESVMDIPDWRSSMIARTEVSFAYNRANTTLYQQAGVNSVKYLAVLDARTCPICRDAAETNGGIYSINDVPTVPQHPRCRCTTVAVFQ